MCVYELVLKFDDAPEFVLVNYVVQVRSDLSTRSIESGPVGLLTLSVTERGIVVNKRTQGSNVY